MSQTDDMPGSKTSNAPEKDSFTGFFYAFGIKERTKEDYKKVKESPAGNRKGEGFL